MPALSLLLTCLLFVILAKPVFAQNLLPPNISLGEKELNSSNFNYLVNGEINFMYTIPNGLIAAFSGISPLGQVPGIKFASDGTTKLYVYDRLPNGGAIGGITSVMMAMYAAPPVSSGEYLAMVMEDFGFAKPVYAQVPGSGSTILSPVAKLWDVVKNLTYLLFIVVFLAVGIMIMFRQKLNPQTVLSVQNALPGLVIGLILVTFSYLIAGAIADISFLFIQLVAQIFIQAAAQGSPNVFGQTSADLQRLANDSNILQLFTSSIRYGDNFQELGKATQDLVNSTIPPASTAAITIIGLVVAAVMILVPFLSTALGIGLGAAALGFGSTSISPINVVSLIVPLILIIALFIQFVRLAFKLLNAYISLLVFTIAGPLIILFASIPGKGGALGLWWKSLLANSLVFPAVFGGFLFAGMILGTDPNLWTATPPLFGGMTTGFIRILIAYGILLGIPAIPDLVKNALGVKDIQGIPQAALQGAQAGAGVIGAGVNRLAAPLQHRAAAYKEAYYRARYPLGGGAPGPAPVEHNPIVRWLSRV